MSRLLQASVLSAALLCAALANAHPTLMSSVPKAGQTVDSPPKELLLRFNEPIEPAFTHVKLAGPGLPEAKASPTEAVKDDANAVAVTLPALSAGVYKARWSAMGRDGHRIKGEFSFTVK